MIELDLQYQLEGSAKQSRPVYYPSETELKTWLQTGLQYCVDHQHCEAESRPFELCVRVVDRAEMQSLNHQYRKKDKPTNVLSFQSDLPQALQTAMSTRVLGDIVLCTEVIIAEAEAAQKSEKAHWAHLIIHGLLHLLGFDHIKDEEAAIMQPLESVILQQLGFDNPYQPQKENTL